MSDGWAVLHGRMSGMLCSCILEITDGETESTLVGVVEGDRPWVFGESHHQEGRDWIFGWRLS